MLYTNHQKHFKQKSIHDPRALLFPHSHFVMKLTNRHEELATSSQGFSGMILAPLIIAVNWKFGRPQKGEEKQTETSNVKHRAGG
jgi:hypothetical protein